MDYGKHSAPVAPPLVHPWRCSSAGDFESADVYPKASPLGVLEPLTFKAATEQINHFKHNCL